MKPTTELVTADELLRMPDDGSRRELIRGEVRTMVPAGRRHGVVAMRLGWRLAQDVEVHGLGEVPAAETGFKIGTEPDTVRAPDVAFIGRERLGAYDQEEGYYQGPPDLAVELVSPRDSHAGVEEKVLEWLDAGTRLVLAVNPRKRTVTAYRSRAEIRILTEADTLEAGDVLPGWSVRIADLFG